MSAKTYAVQTLYSSTEELFDASGDFSGPVEVVLQNQGPSDIAWGASNVTLTMNLKAGETFRFSSPDQNVNIFVRASNNDPKGPNGGVSNVSALVTGTV